MRKLYTLVVSQRTGKTFKTQKYTTKQIGTQFPSPLKIIENIILVDAGH